MEQMMIVSMKVPVIEIRPCSAGHFVLAAAAAIGAEPRPDSLEKTPRATPFCMAIMTVEPAKPPAAAAPVKASLMIMDEPTTALTQREVDNLIRVINGLRASGVAVLFVSHKLDECYAIGGQVIILRDGEKVAQGPIADYTKSQLMQLMTGKHLDGRRYRTGAATGEVVLQAKHLGASGAFENVSFELRRGEILGLTGLLDSGRNELALALAGVSPADSGELFIDNEAQHFKTPADAIAKGIGYVPEDRLSEGLFLDKPIRDNVVTAVLASFRGYDTLGETTVVFTAGAGLIALLLRVYSGRSADAISECVRSVERTGASGADKARLLAECHGGDVKPERYYRQQR
mgnify:CR=1 FL=1